MKTCQNVQACLPSRYRYQGLKYDRLVALLPRKRFAYALDLGCGLGLLSQKLTARAERVLGVDIASTAIEHARRRGAAFDNLAFEPGDILDLPTSLNGRFDLVVVADVLYYLSPLDDAVLRSVVRRIADLLTPGGTCLLANHFFFAADPESRISRKIHRRFKDCSRFAVTSEHRRAFSWPPCCPNGRTCFPHDASRRADRPGCCPGGRDGLGFLLDLGEYRGRW
jgi:predicted TPR repeat methyltransferase